MIEKKSNEKRKYEWTEYDLKDREELYKDLSEEELKELCKEKLSQLND